MLRGYVVAGSNFAGLDDLAVHAAIGVNRLIEWNKHRP